MDKLNLPPFYIGQKVVAIVDHSQLAFKKGDEFIVQDCFINCIGEWSIYIGILQTYTNPGAIVYRCRDCKKIHRLQKQADFYAKSFAPLIKKPLPLLTFEKIKETEKEEILILN